jgi:uncharacterized protein YkwD
MRGGLARIVAASTLVVALLAMSASVAPAASATLRRVRMLEKVNHARVERGVHTLKMDDEVVKIAHAHNVAMAMKKALFHTADLGAKLRRVSWRVWGENVGVGMSMPRLFRAYMASPDHRANILNGRFTHVGISFIVRHGVMWSTLIFYG